MAQTGVYQAIQPISTSIIRRGTSYGSEAAGQTYKAGAPLEYSSGTIIEAQADSVIIIGIAAKDATGVTGATVPFFTILPGETFEFTCDDGGTFDAADVGGQYGLKKDAGTGAWYIDTSELEDQVTIISLAPGWAVGDTKPRVYARFNTTAGLLD